MKLYKLLACTGLLSLSLSFAYFASAQEAPKDAYFILTSKENTVKKGDTVNVILALSNPSKQNIASFETWITYDPLKVKGKTVDFGTSPDFDLNLVKDDPFTPENKVFKVSRLATNPTSGKDSFVLATAQFEVLTDTTGDQLNFDFYQDPDGSLTKNSANVVVDDVATNIVDYTKLKSLVIPVGQGSAPVNTNTNTAVSTNLNTNSSVVTVGSENTNTNNATQATTDPTTSLGSLGTSNPQTSDFADLSPDATTILNTLPAENTNVNSSPLVPSAPSTVTKTAPGDIEFSKAPRSIGLSWSRDPAAVSTVIYYSTVRDQFARSKNLSVPLSEYTFKNLKANTTYYFVLSHLYSDGTESPTTKEYEVQTGTTETLRFDVLKSAAGGPGTVKAYDLSDQARASLKKVPSTPANGPEHILFVLGALSIAFAGYFTFKHKTT